MSSAVERDAAGPVREARDAGWRRAELAAAPGPASRREAGPPVSFASRSRTPGQLRVAKQEKPLRLRVRQASCASSDSSNPEKRARYSVVPLRTTFSV